MKKQYKHLSLLERERVAILKAEGLSMRAIGRALDRDHGTISRELKRNKWELMPGYYPSVANSFASERKSKACEKYRLRNPEVRKIVHQLLSLHWSPEIISGWLKRHHPDKFVSHEAIYQYIYKKAKQFIPCLPRQHQKRRKKKNLRKTRKVKIPHRTSILERPFLINQRLEFGHWESDAIVSRQNLFCLNVLVERKSRYAKITKLSRNSAHLTQRAIKLRLIDLPKEARLSITYDNGSENTQHEAINDFLETQSYFCEPYHSWEKGSVENLNGLIRRFFPKSSDLKKIKPHQLAKVEFWLNNRPRKCLNFKTPAEVFFEHCGALPP